MGQLLAAFSLVGSVLLLLLSMSPTPYALGFYTSSDPVRQAAIVQPMPATKPSDGTRLTVQGMSVVRSPSIDVATIHRVLQSYGSPALGEAQAIYDLGVRYGVDPAICLAFFIAESSAGTQGIARETRSVGNIRATSGYVNYKGYRKYSSWREGIEDWYRLITRLYVEEWGLDTVETIVPVYAPTADNNKPDQYISSVRRLVTDWRAGWV